MKRVLAALVGLVLSAASSSQAPAAAVDTLDQVKQKGVLAVGVREATPPFGYFDREKREIVGAEVDLAAAVARRLGVSPVFVPLAASERIEALLDGKVDLVAAAFSKTPNREKIVDFSLTYFKTHQKVLARKGAVSALKDLAGKKIAVVRGTTSEGTLRAKVPGAIVVPAANLQGAIDALRSGDADLVTGDAVPLSACLATLPEDQYEIPGAVTLGDERYGMAVRKGSAKFLQAVDEALVEIKTSGEADKIIGRWFVRKDAPEAGAAPKAAPAGGAVLRAAGSEGRYVVIPLRGTFRQSAEVTFYDMQGEVVCRGVVHSVYGDDVYVDAAGPRAGEVVPGYAVGAGVSPEEAKKIIAARKEVLESVKAESRKEAAERQKEVGQEYAREKAEREKYQEDMTRRRMELDYQYGDDYWHYRGYGYWPEWGW